MPALVVTLNYWLSVGAILLEILAAIGVVIFIARTRFPKITEWIGAGALGAAFLLASAGVVLSLVYSDYFGFVACGLCWLQRIFLYPLPVIFALALWKNDRVHAPLYAMGLAILGGIIALYQHYLQIGGTSVLPCPATPGAADCAQRFLFEFGYITFPLIAASVFGALIVLMLFARRR